MGGTFTQPINSNRPENTAINPHLLFLHRVKKEEKILQTSILFVLHFRTKLKDTARRKKGDGGRERGGKKKEKKNSK